MEKLRRSHLSGLWMISSIALIIFGATHSFAEEPLLSTPCTTEMYMDGTIGPATQDELVRALSFANKNKCGSLLIIINTPGGSLASTRSIVEEILNSKIPVLCLIAPPGGHAGSAGAIIMQACHIAGALKATNIGAATPIASTGQEMPKDLRNKMVNDTKSWVEGLANHRGRNPEFAKDIIEKAKAVTAEDALKLKAIDVIPENKSDFLKWATHREVKVSDNEMVKVLIGEILPFTHDLRYRVMDLLMDPQLAYMMFMGSLGLLYFEITHPGMIVPGVVGAVGLLVSLVSLDKLDVQWGGLLLILLGVAFMVAEAFVASFGMLGVGGVISFFMGSLFLFDPKTSGYQLELSVIIPTTILLGIITMAIAYMAFGTRNVKSSAAFDVIEGKEGRVVNVNKNGMGGQLEVNGETWKFESESQVEVGQNVVIESHKGFTLKIKV